MKNTSGFRKKKLTFFISTAYLAFASGSVFAGPCPAPVAGAIIINSATDQSCHPADNTVVTVTGAGSITEAVAPLNITGVVVDNGINANSISNAGTISTNNGAVGVQGAITGDVINSGTMNSVGATVSVTGTVTGNIVNSGAVTSSGDAGIRLTNGSVGGNITNTASGSIINSQYGVAAGNTSTVHGDISNSGTLFGSVSGVLVSGAVVTGAVTNNGAITGNSGSGVEINSSTGATSIGSILNMMQGQVSSLQGNAIQVSDTTIAGGIANAGSINGSGESGVKLNNTTITAGGVTNTGSIIGSGNSGIALIGSNINAGGISNSASGTINGGQFGITVRNTSTVNGDIANSGAIDGGTSGIVVSGGMVSGAVTNSGTINSNFASAVDIDSSTGATTVGRIANTAQGQIISTQGNGILVDDSTVIDGIGNAGIVAGSGDSGIRLGNAVINGSGLVNTTTGVITGTQNGVLLKFGSVIHGDIVNDGSFSGGVSGLLLAGGSVTGAITNNGVIQGTTGNGLELNNLTSATSVGTINNTAQGHIISAQANGVEIANAAVVNNIVNSGHISGALIGVHAAQSTIGGAISNAAGGVIAGNDGVVIESGAVVGAGVSNSGAVTASGGSGIRLNNATITAGGVANTAAGMISGTQYGVLIENASIVHGDVTNSGTINGSVAGVGITGGAVNGNIVNNGTINAGPAGVGIQISNASLTGAITNIGTIIGAMAVDVASATAPVTINNTGLLAGDVLLGDGTLNLNGGAAQVTGAITGNGASSVNVNGAFATAADVNVGAVNIAASGVFTDQNDVTVASGVTNAGKIVLHAATPVTIHGDYTQTASAVYAMQAVSPTVYSKLNVSGVANLAPNAGIDVNVSTANTLSTGSVLKGVIQAGTLNASTFNVTDNSALFNFVGVVDGNSVDLSVARGPSVYQDTFANHNFAGSGAAHTFDYLIDHGAAGVGSMSSVITALAQLQTDKQVSDAVKQTLPLLSGAAAMSLMATIHQVNRAVQARQEDPRGLSAGDGYVSDQHLWVKPFGSWARQSDDNGAAGFTSNTAGFLAGVDGAVSAHDRIGAAVAYAHVHQDSSDGVAPQSDKIDSYQIIAYGSHAWDRNTFFNWQADLGTHNTDGNRSIAFSGANKTALSSYNGWSAHLGMGVGRTYDINALTSFTPWLRVDYATVKNRAYTESGADALNLNVASQTAQELVIAAESKLLYSLSDTFSLSANAGLGYDLLAKNATIVSSFSGGGPAFSTDGISPARLLALIGIGTAYHGNDGYEINARYDAEARSRFTNQTLSVKFRKSF